MGLERGEGIVRHLRFGRGNARYQCALARIRKADEGDVGHQLEFEVQPALLPHLPLLGERRRPSLVGQEAGVAPTPPAAGGDEEPVARGHEVAEHMAVAVLHHRPFGHRHVDVDAVGAVLALPLTVHTVGGPPEGMVTKPKERRHVVVRQQPDIAAIAAVTAIGAAFGHVRFTAKRHRARATVPGLGMNLRFIDEPGHARVCRTTPPRRAFTLRSRPSPFGDGWATTAGRPL